jgi:hypothetical protein
MSTPPPSHSSSHRGTGSSPKKRKLPDRRREQDSDYDPFVSPDLDLDQTPRPPFSAAAGSITSSAPQLSPGGCSASNRIRRVPLLTHSPSVASDKTGSTSASARSRARSTSPTKKTQSLDTLRKPIYFTRIEDNATQQLPPDVRELYNRLYELTVEHEGVFPSEARAEINEAVGRAYKDPWFRKRRYRSTPATETEHALSSSAGEQQQLRSEALAELTALRKVERAAWECRRLGRSEAGWNTYVHHPVLELGLAGLAYARTETVTTAQIAKPFVPAMNDYAVTEFADKKMVDLALVLDPNPPGPSAATADAGDADVAAARCRRLTRAIKRAVHSQPAGQQTINQTTFTPLCRRPLAVSIETKCDGSSEQGRLQLAIWAAAWHERMRRLVIDVPAAQGDEGVEAGVQGVGETKGVATLPLLLIVDHAWTLSFVCDRGDRLEIVGDMRIGDTQSLLGLYTLVAAVRELGLWVEGPFCDWMASALAGFDGVTQ